MIDNPSYDRVLADQEDKTKLPKFQLYQINKGDFIGTIYNNPVQIFSVFLGFAA